MFFNHDNPKIYGRACVYRIKFISFKLSAFSIHKAGYDYIADYEFLKKLESLLNVDLHLKPLEKPNRRHTLIILLDLLSIEIMALLKINNDILYTFESYFNDSSLHLLSKGET